MRSVGIECEREDSVGLVLNCFEVVGISRLELRLFGSGSSEFGNSAVGNSHQFDVAVGSQAVVVESNYSASYSCHDSRGSDIGVNEHFNEGSVGHTIGEVDNLNYILLFYNVGSNHE